MVALPSAQLGEFRSAPAELTSAIPAYPVVAPNPLWHPQLASTGTGETAMPLEPSNDSILAEECPRELQFGQVGGLGADTSEY